MGMSNIMSTRFAAALLFGVLVTACATDTADQYFRDGERYGVTEGTFRGRWWSFYERGASFLSGGFTQEAEADLKVALQGRSRDTWRARTYGLHFVEYFPNRELGITYFYKGDLEEAAEYLQRSLSHVDTGRAHFYYDQVRKEKIARGLLPDEDDPAIRTSVAQGAFLSSPLLELDVSAVDDVGVHRLQINERALPLRGSKPEVSRTERMVLAEGQHQISVTATDLADKSVEETLNVTVDLTGPTIGIFTPTEALVTREPTLRLEGASADTNGVVSVTLGDQVLVDSPGEQRVQFATDLQLEEGANNFVLIAHDVAGNETRTAVTVYRGDPDSTQAQLWLLQQRRPELLHVATAAQVPLSLILQAAADTPAPSGITIRSPSPDRPYRHNRVLRISGEVVAPVNLASLSINGEPLEALTGAPKETFNKGIPLEIGEDDEEMEFEVAVHAEDEDGTAYDERIRVNVRPVTLETRESRMPVAVLAFAGQGVEPAVAEQLRLSTEGQIFEQGRFRVLDRTRLQDVLQEQELVAAALTDPNEAIRIGRLTPAHVFLVGTVFPKGDGVEIMARAISTETADIVATLDVFIEDQSDSTLVAEGCAALADQLRQVFPRLSGEVLSVRARGDSAELLVNWTQEDGVRQGAYLLMLHEDEPWIDETTGEVLEPGMLVEVGRARITATTATSTRAETVERNEEVPLEQGMPAISM